MLSPSLWRRFTKDSRKSPRGKSRWPRAWRRTLVCERLEDRTLLNCTPGLDDFGNTFADAHLVSLTAAGAGAQAGCIEIDGDVDFFRFVAQSSGQLTIRQQASGGGLDSVLTVFDVAQQEIASNDDDPDDITFDSRVEVHVLAGQTYFVRAAGFGGSTGAYTLTFGTPPDDFGNTFATARGPPRRPGRGHAGGRRPGGARRGRVPLRGHGDRPGHGAAGGRGRAGQLPGRVRRPRAAAGQQRRPRPRHPRQRGAVRRGGRPDLFRPRRRVRFQRRRLHTHHLLRGRRLRRHRREGPRGRADRGRARQPGGGHRGRRRRGRVPLHGPDERAGGRRAERRRRPAYAPGPPAGRVRRPERRTRAQR